VWWAAPADADPALVDLLDPVETARSGRYRRAIDRDRFVVGVAITRLALSRVLRVPPDEVGLDRTCASCGRPHGAPRPVDAGHLSVSVSHAGNRVLVAVGDGIRVGVDVEPADRAVDLATLVPATLTAAEEHALGTTSSPHRGFLTYWTRKEAVLKALGTGLSTPARAVEVTAPWASPAVVGGPCHVVLTDLDLAPAHVGALAAVGARPHVTVEPAGALLGAWIGS
jgi:4'-phosphopantetheinyl transferase